MAAKRKSARRPVKRKAARKVANARRPKRHQPESLRLRGASPGFTVNDLQKSIAFYRDVLGFTTGEDWSVGGKLMGMELKAGSVTLWLSQDDWAKGRDRVKGVGFRLFLTTAQDIDAVTARVRAAGDALLNEPHEEFGMRSIGVRDPDGFVLTIQRPLPKRR